MMDDGSTAETTNTKLFSFDPVEVKWKYICTFKYAVKDHKHVKLLRKIEIPICVL